MEAPWLRLTILSQIMSTYLLWIATYDKFAAYYEYEYEYAPNLSYVE